MKIVTQDGVLTDLRWWKQLRFPDDKSAIYLSGSGEEPKLTIADYGPKHNEVLFAALNAALTTKRDLFDVRLWAHGDPLNDGPVDSATG